MDNDPATPLFQVVPAEFVAARNALVGELKKAGKKAEAAAVKALTRPSVSAFALNQVARKHPEAIAAFLASSDEIARAQAGGVGNEIARKAFQTALGHQREALDKVRARAGEQLAAVGLEAGRGVLEKVESDLRFAVLDDQLRQQVVAGRLLADLEAPDFSALVGRIALAPPLSQEPAEAPAASAPRIVQPVPEQDARQSARMEAAAQARRLRGELERTEAEVARARKHAWAQKTACERAESQRNEARTKLQAAEAELATRARAQADAEAALAAAEQQRQDLAAALAKAAEASR